jgi:diketogulonate reductase-like aldo/keto reductase
METLGAIAKSHGATPAQIALAWVIHSPAVAAIPGASSVDQIEHNAAAAEIALTEDEYQALCDASDRVSALHVTEPPSALNLSSLKHLARGTRYVAKTVWQDLRA